ncbi:efflux RND transporter permease subunit [Leptospira licerasiae]|uniref:RND transporter, Hydrophobe/Amphiphile Efflux-1 (HAE1)/Heavy Metal Efflux (HME) family, permease protein n=1 Tax=Leptospira licerasiae str. MMD4847 TaxID=1049971 RepID=A0ABN0H8P7_9LEPT|nr:efflux RND transporter permease subunit [Leptospira licerasiae]EID99637.1 RND transporter, Hydrophobe/Amphiphile Efflux-1 (HAE1)/Heavy Metal Efflux (HME) family, permease protein [Leptospira licerasiae serovar Varillal str. VAR 010]EJZ41665.1 RND transporter, Hydrophobe/Amphiphile Efflux-1 (HAE1)/Heavy Metal Efflux (HME) family, permease protein [Leptospira licerasiae str. MMD4847]
MKEKNKTRNSVQIDEEHKVLPYPNTYEAAVKQVNQSGIAAFSVKNPYLMIVGCTIVLVLGILALFKMPRDLLPPSIQPAVQILDVYWGMPTSSTETILTWKFERYTGQAPGLIHQESKSYPGVSVVNNFFDEASTTRPEAMGSTVGYIMSVLRRLPPGAMPPIVLPFDPMGSTPVCLVAVSGDFPINDLYDRGQYDVRRALQGTPGTIAPTVMGGAEKQVIIELDPNKLKRFDMSAAEAMEKIEKLNTFIPAGDVKIGDFDYPIYTNGVADTVKAFDDFPLRSREGISVFVKDVGQAKEASIVQTEMVTLDGKEIVYVPVLRQQGANTLAVVDAAKEAMKELEKEFKGLKLRVVADTTVFIRKAVETVAEEAMFGGGLAALMVFLFLGNPRATFATLLSLPFSTFFVLMGLKATGSTINIMTLGGMALSIGLLVDNSIVAIENIMRHLAEDKDVNRVKVVVRAAQEVTPPIIAVTLCNIVVLFPILLTKGVVNVLFGAIAKTVILAITGSLLSETAIIPLFASKFLTGPPPKLPRFFQIIQDWIAKLTEVYGRLLEKVIFNLKGVLIGIAILFTIGGICVPFIGTELFPRADAGSFVLHLRFPSGLRIEETSDRAKQVEAKLKEWLKSDLEMVLSDSGLYQGFPAAFSQNGGTQDVTMNVELKEDRKKTSQYYAKLIREKLPKEFPDVQLGIELGGLLSSSLNGGAQAPINIQVRGANAAEAYKIAQGLLPEIKKVKGATDVRILESFDTPAIEVNINRKKADAQGVLTTEIVQNIVSALSGSIVYKPAIWVDPKTGIDYALGVRFPQENFKTMKDFQGIPVTGKFQERAIPLDRLSDIEKTEGPTVLSRVNMKRTVNILADAQGRDIGSVSSDIEKIIRETKAPSGYKIVITGEIEKMRDSLTQLGGGFFLSAFLVYMILVVQFRSFILPGIMMMTVPLGMVGIVLMFALSGTYYSLQAGIGTIFLIGIAVSNGVLLIEFILHMIQHERMDLDRGIIEGAKARLRPIMMTSLASMLGLTPMAIGFGKGAEANIPLGRAVIGGQFLATLLTIFVLPAIFRYLYSKFYLKSGKVEV